jgi:hypothetical protein
MNSQEFAAFLFFAQFLCQNIINIRLFSLLKLSLLGGMIHKAKFAIITLKEGKLFYGNIHYQPGYCHYRRFNALPFNKAC